MTRVVIVGGGFAGLYAAKNMGMPPFDVTLIDRRNFHLFQPLLYQVATGALSPGEVASPLRHVLSKQRNTEVLLGDVIDFDIANRYVIMATGAIPYDELIVATGSTHSYFGHDEWPALAPGLKTVEDATEIRSRVLRAFELAECETDPDRRHALLSFVIVGGGPTGVELAGALGEIANDTLRHDFRRINPAEAQIQLVEGDDRLLTAFPPDLSAKAEQQLIALKVRPRTGARVVAIDPDGVVIRTEAGDERIPAKTVLWAAGVKASPLGKLIADRTGIAPDRMGRLPVQPDLTLAGHPEIHIAGDLANYPHQTGSPLPGVAPVAMQQGRYAAQHIRARLQGRTLPPFHYRDKGNLATIGRNKAVGVIANLHLSGFPAWFVWVFVHLMYLVEFENRMLVLMEWVFNYITRNRGARLITGKP
jgi:NADH:ubiquinone reductase (H+-translocating)